MEDYLLVLMDSRLLISCVADFDEKVVVICHGNIEIIGRGQGERRARALQRKCPSQNLSNKQEHTPWTEAWNPEFRSPHGKPWHTSVTSLWVAVKETGEYLELALWLATLTKSPELKSKAKTLVMTHKLTSGMNDHAQHTHIHSSTHMYTCLHMHGHMCSYTLTLKNTLPGEEGRKILAFRVH